MDLSQVKQQIIESIDVNILFEGLHPQNSGNYLVIDCPNCGKHRAFYYKNSAIIKCNRLNECGYNKSIFDYYSEKMGISTNDGKGFVSVVIPKLCELANIPIDNNDIKDFVSSYEHKQKDIKLLKDIQSYYIECLYTDKGKEGLEYLYKRGYNDEQIKVMGFGYNVGWIETLRHFKLDKFPDCLNYIKDRDNHKITFLYNDNAKNPITIYGRRIDDISTAKYMNFGTIKKDIPFLIDKVDNKAKQIVICEGYFDALAAYAHGFNNVIAATSSNIPKDMFDNIFKYFPNASICLLLDNDAAGINGTIASIKYCYLNNKYDVVATHISKDNGKDIDDILRLKNGANILNNTIKSAINGAKYTIKYIIDEIYSQTDLSADTLKEIAIKRALEYISTLNSRRLIDDVKQALLDDNRLNLKADSIDFEIDNIKQKVATEKQRKELETILRTASNAQTDGTQSTADIITGLSTKIEQIKAATTVLDDETADGYNGADYSRDMMLMMDGLKSGWHYLENNQIRIPQGAITIFVGRPNEGKTLILNNTLVNMVSEYPDNRFIYFSFEEANAKIFLKLFSIYSDMDYNTCKNYLNGHIEAISDSDIDVLRTKYKIFNELCRSKHIELINKQEYTAKDIRTLINAKLQRDNTISGVFIDYIQKIPSDKDYLTQSRQYQIQQTSEQLRQLAVETNLAIITAAQANRDEQKERKSNKDYIPQLHNLRECGDIEQDANLMIGIAQPNRMEEKEIVVPNSSIDMNIKVIKNRDGATPNHTTLTFIPSLRLKEDIDRINDYKEHIITNNKPVNKPKARKVVL